MDSVMMPDPAAPSTPLYVRLPRREADLLDKAAFEQRLSKRALVTDLVARGLGDDEPPTVVPGRLVRGRYSFRPLPLPVAPPEVLTLPQAAELLQVSESELDALAEAGGLPARRLGGEWRFARAALLAWLAEGEPE